MGLDPRCYPALALLLLVLPLPWLIAAAVAGAFHELCHLGAVRLLGGQAGGLRLGPRGAQLQAVLPGRGRELIAVLAGPVGSLCLIALAPAFPRLAVCGAVQGLYNLLPVEPLDGGRALRLCLGERFSGQADAVLTGTRAAAILVALVLAAVARWWLPLAVLLWHLPRRSTE